MSEQEYSEIISKNLQRIMYEHGKTQADLSRDLNISKATISSWINGTRIPRMSKVDLLCHYFNVRRRDIMEAPTDELTNLSTPAAYPVPIIGTICAGHGVLCEDDFQGFFFVDRTIRADFCLNVNGDSMIESHIYDGDKAFIRKECDYINGRIYAVRINDETEAVLKRVFWYADKIVLNASNPAYDPIVESPQNVSIIGEYIGVYHPAE